jgi:hypothetical protein
MITLWSHFYFRKFYEAKLLEFLQNEAQSWREKVYYSELSVSHSVKENAS